MYSLSWDHPRARIRQRVRSRRMSRTNRLCRIPGGYEGQDHPCDVAHDVRCRRLKQPGNCAETLIDAGPEPEEFLLVDDVVRHVGGGC
jgi:hypothetical protein